MNLQHAALRICALVKEPSIGLLFCCLMFALPLVTTAQDESAEDGTGIAQEGAEPESSDIEDAEEALPAIFRDRSASLFAAPTVLQAHKLRGLSGQAASLVMLGSEGGSIAIEASATPLAKDGDKTSVGVFVEIDGSTFLENNQAPVARVEVYAYAVNAERKVSGYLAEVFAINIQELGEAVWQSGLKFHGTLKLPSGRYTLRVLVRNYQSEANALREVKLEIPEDTPALPLVFAGPEARDAWLPIKPWESDLLEPYPLSVEGRAISPSSRPVLVGERTETAYFFSDSIPVGRLRGTVFFRRDGQDIGDASVDGSVSEAANSAGWRHAALPFVVPDFEPGNIEITARLVDASGQTWNLPDIQAFILQKGARERELLWTDLRARVAAPQLASASPKQQQAKRPSRGKMRKKRIRELAARYQEALRARATQENGSLALSALLDLESEILTTRSGGSSLLLASQLKLAQDFAKQDLEALIPLLQVHRQLYKIYRQRRLFSLAAHTRTMIEQVAELYAAEGNSEGSRVVAARVLTSLAGHLQTANLPSSSRRLFLRALELDPMNRAAMLGLAISYERFGERARTIDTLELLVERHPRFGEGLVRLAINVQRFGQRARARELFNQALATKARPWIRSLAYQELARSHLLTGDIGRVVELLEEALKEDPKENGALVLLAHAYDRMRQPQRSMELTRSLTETRRVSARKNYDDWPLSILRDQRQKIGEAAEVRQASLQRLIAGGNGP